MPRPALFSDTAGPGQAARAALRGRFDVLERDLERRVTRYAGLTGAAKAEALHELLLELELPLKLEEQLLLPALEAAEPAWKGELHDLSAELGLVRDAAQLLRCSGTLCHELALALLQGMARLHASRLQALLRRPGAPDMDWAAALREAEALLKRWSAEIRAQGDIDDEDIDPVGPPSR